MREVNGWWIVCGVLAFVLMLNLGLILSFLRSQAGRPKGLFRKSLGEMLNPWREEDEALERLAKDVEALRDARRQDESDENE